MKKFLFCLSIIIFVASCSSTPTQTTTTAPQQPVRNIARMEIIDEKGYAFGVEQPQWVAPAIEGSSKVSALYPGKRAFVLDSRGKNLKLLQRKSNTTEINAVLSRIAGTAIIQNARNILIASGEDINADEYSDAIQQASRASFSGLVPESDWWILQSDGQKEEYTYLVLYLIDEKLFERQFGNINGRVADAIGDTALANAVKRETDSALELFDKMYESQNR